MVLLLLLKYLEKKMNKFISVPQGAEIDVQGVTEKAGTNVINNVSIFQL